MNGLLHADQQFFVFLNHSLAHPAADALFRFVTTPRFILWPLAIVVLLSVWKGGARARSAFVLIVIAVVIGDALANTIRELVQRPRPFVSLDTVRLLVGRSPSFSFPSGHATNSFAAATVMAAMYWRRWWIVGVSLLLALLVAWSRIHVGVHYPVDVTAGACLGAVVGWSVCRVWRRFNIPAIWRPLEAESVEGHATDAWLGLAVLVVALVASVRLTFIANPAHMLVPEEACHWEWSRRAGWCLSCGSPGAAYLIRLGTAIGGNREFFVRVPAVILSLVLAWVTWLFAKRMGQSSRSAFFCVLTLNLMPLLAIGGIVMTAQTLLVVCWAVALYCVYLGVFADRPRAWYPAGITLGLGLLGGVSMLLLLPCLAIFFVVSPGRRSVLRSPQPWIALAIALILFSPVVIARESAGWVAGCRIPADTGAAAGFTRSAQEAARFVLSQLYLVSPVMLILILGVAWRELSLSWRSRSCSSLKSGSDDTTRFLLCTSLPVLLVAFAASLTGLVPADATAAAYYALIPLVVGVLDTWYAGRAASGRGLLPRILVISALVTAGTVTGMTDLQIPTLPVRWAPSLCLDPAPQMAGWRDLAGFVDRVRQGMPDPQGTLVVTGDERTAAELAFYLPGHPITFYVGTGPGAGQRDQCAGDVSNDGRDAVYVCESDSPSLSGSLTSCFDACTAPLGFGRRLRKATVQRYLVCGCSWLSAERLTTSGLSLVPLR